jgi:hypothetical protein
MSSLAVDAQFFRGILTGLVLATVIAGVALVYTMLAVPSPPIALTVALQSS